MTHSARALEYFLGGYNCSQATAAPFASDFGLEAEAVLKMMAGFGAGRGGLRETCGAVNAMAFVASLAFGDYPVGDTVAKETLYAGCAVRLTSRKQLLPGSPPEGFLPFQA